MLKKILVLAFRITSYNVCYTKLLRLSGLMRRILPEATVFGMQDRDSLEKTLKEILSESISASRDL